MDYEDKVIAESEIPTASAPIFQHLLMTYASEVNKLNSVWTEMSNDDLFFKPHERSSTVAEIIEHELLSERRFFGEFLELDEVPASAVLPIDRNPQAYAARMVELSRA